jgi:hypothetical protein
VLANPVAVVDEVAGRECALGLQVDVAAVAISEVPLILMLVTAEAGRHLGAKLGRLRLGHSDVTAHAVPLHVGHVRSVLEAQMLARKFCTLAHERLAVAAAACVLVVGFGVAAAADGVGGKVERTGIPRERDSGVAGDAVDPLDHVRAMLEGVRRRRLREPEHACARRERERKDR